MEIGLSISKVYGKAGGTFSRRLFHRPSFPRPFAASFDPTLASIVYQATPNDPLVLAGVVCTMVLVGALATWIPARRVLSVDPTQVLREE